MGHYKVKALLEGKVAGTFLFRDSAQEDYLFSVASAPMADPFVPRLSSGNTVLMLMTCVCFAPLL